MLFVSFHNFIKFIEQDFLLWGADFHYFYQIAGIVTYKSHSLVFHHIHIHSYVNAALFQCVNKFMDILYGKCYVLGSVSADVTVRIATVLS